jgi:hypothetical protein
VQCDGLYRGGGTSSMLMFLDSVSGNPSKTNKLPPRERASKAIKGRQKVRFILFLLNI